MLLLLLRVLLLLFDTVAAATNALTKCAYFFMIINNVFLISLGNLALLVFKLIMKEHATARLLFYQC